MGTTAKAFKKMSIKKCLELFQTISLSCHTHNYHWVSHINLSGVGGAIKGMLEQDLENQYWSHTTKHVYKTQHFTKVKPQIYREVWCCFTQRCMNVTKRGCAVLLPAHPSQRQRFLHQLH